mmetsp:Transcript_7382/g.11025  ORF Transcript_7382/g.11025 Transcript_7382/m.11025 type:complete len:87 (+) Transcript_7382:804-1064(+)
MKMARTVILLMTVFRGAVTVFRKANVNRVLRMVKGAMRMVIVFHIIVNGPGKARNALTMIPGLPCKFVLSLVVKANENHFLCQIRI